MLGSAPYQLFLARLQLIASTEAASLTLDGAGIDAREDVARTKCLFEALERLVATAPQTVAERSSQSVSPGARVIRWQDLAPYSEAELSALEPDPASNRWCSGRGLVSETEYAVPASKVFPAWSLSVGNGFFDGECDASGLAAGDAEDCVRHGLFEILERDAIMLAWRLSDWPTRHVERSVLGNEVAGFLRDAGLDVDLYDVGDDALAPVLLCVLRDRRGGLACGSASADDRGAAASRAVLEAIMLWHQLKLGPPPPDGTGIRTSVDHVAWAWRNASAVSDWFARLPRTAAERPSGADGLFANCRATFFGAEPVVVDLGRPDGGPAEARVCRVVQPHAFRKEWNAELPFLGGLRFRSRLSPGTTVNRLPHPYG